jgi:RNA polymerase sigma factor (sigma-70 family)
MVSTPLPRFEFSGDAADPTPDGELIQACLAGNTAGFRLLYRRHQQRVRSLLFRLCGPSSLDDLVQEVFLRAWQGLPKMRQASLFSTWLFRIAWNVATDYRRRAAQQRTRLDLLSQQTPTQQSPLDWSQMHYQDLVERGLEHLSFDHRAVVVLHDLEGLALKEVAEILTIPAGTVKSRLFHARTALRKFLEQAGIQV